MDTLKAVAATLTLATFAAAGPLLAAPEQEAAAQRTSETAQPNEGRPAKDQKMANRPDIRSGESVEDEMEDLDRDDEQSGLGGVATGDEAVSHPSGRRAD